MRTFKKILGYAGILFSLHATSQYCDTSIDLGFGITNFSFNQIMKGSAVTAYSDFTSISTDVIQGGRYTVNITPSTTFEFYAGVYIDFNGDGDFEDSDEFFPLGLGDGDAFYDGPEIMDIPLTAAVGSTRLRIIISAIQNITTDPCAAPTSTVFGEVEDYTVDIISSTFYSIQDGAWSDPSGWSTTGHTGAACDCLPLSDHDVDVFVNHTVNLTEDTNSGNLTLGVNGQVSSSGSSELRVEEDRTLTLGSGSRLESLLEVSGSLIVQSGATIQTLFLNLPSNGSILNYGHVNPQEMALNAIFDNHGLVEVNDIISASNYIVNQATGTIRYNGGAIPSNPSNYIDLTSDGNTVEISGANNLVPDLTYSKLTILPSASNLGLSQPITVNDNLVLENFLYLNSLDLTMGDAAAIHADTHWIITNLTGTLKQAVGTSPVVFPVGLDEHTYLPVTLANQGVIDDFRVRVVDHVYQDGGDGTSGSGRVISNVVDKTWFIEQESGTNADVTLTFQWNETDEVSDFDRSQVQVTHFDGSDWVDLGSLSPAVEVNPTTFATSIDEISDFSPFTVKSGDTQLPIDLHFFRGEASLSNEVHLTWETLQEQNNESFTVERSVDGIQWDIVHKLPGAGNSSTPIAYSYVDYHALPGRNFYRLKQTDFDGKYVYFPWVLVTLGSPDLQLYPNPTKGLLRVQGAEEIEDFQVWSFAGEHVRAQTKSTRQGSLLLLDVSALEAGIYLIKVGKKSLPFIKN